MMNVKKNNLIDVFAHHDRPVLYSYLGDDGIIYLWSLIETTDQHEKWLVSDVSSETYKQLKAGEISFYTCFKNSMSGKSTVKVIQPSGSGFFMEFISSDLPDEMLPDKSTYVVPEKGVNND